MTTSTIVESVVQAYRDAVHNRDTEALKALYVDDVRVFDLMAPWQQTNSSDWAKFVALWFDHLAGLNATGDAEFADIAIVETGEMALLCANVNYTNTTPDGRTRSIYADDTSESAPEAMWNRLTWVLKADGDAWKIIHEHTSVPLSNQDMSPVFDPNAS